MLSDDLFSSQAMHPNFHERYKIVITCELKPNYFEMIEWVNNISIGLATFAFGLTTKYKTDVFGKANTIYFAFENEDDATFFKIKYGN